MIRPIGENQERPFILRNNLLFDSCQNPASEVKKQVSAEENPPNLASLEKTKVDKKKEEPSAKPGNSSSVVLSNQKVLLEKIKLFESKVILERAKRKNIEKECLHWKSVAEELRLKSQASLEGNKEGKITKPQNPGQTDRKESFEQKIEFVRIEERSDKNPQNVQDQPRKDTKIVESTSGNFGFERDTNEGIPKTKFGVQIESEQILTPISQGVQQGAKRVVLETSMEDYIPPSQTGVQKDQINFGAGLHLQKEKTNDDPYGFGDDSQEFHRSTSKYEIKNDKKKDDDNSCDFLKSSTHSKDHNPFEEGDNEGRPSIMNNLAYGSMLGERNSRQPQTIPPINIAHLKAEGESIQDSYYVKKDSNQLQKFSLTPTPATNPNDESFVVRPSIPTIAKLAGLNSNQNQNDILTIEEDESSNPPTSPQIQQQENALNIPQHRYYHFGEQSKRSSQQKSRNKEEIVEENESLRKEVEILIEENNELKRKMLRGEAAPIKAQKVGRENKSTQTGAKKRSVLSQTQLKSKDIDDYRSVAIDAMSQQSQPEHSEKNIWSRVDQKTLKNLITLGGTIRSNSRSKSPLGDEDNLRSNNGSIAPRLSNMKDMHEGVLRSPKSNQQKLSQVNQLFENSPLIGSSSNRPTGGFPNLEAKNQAPNFGEAFQEVQFYENKKGFVPKGSKEGISNLMTNPETKTLSRQEIYEQAQSIKFAKKSKGIQSEKNEFSRLHPVDPEECEYDFMGMTRKMDNPTKKGQIQAHRVSLSMNDNFERESSSISESEPPRSDFTAISKMASTPETKVLASLTNKFDGELKKMALQLKTNEKEKSALFKQLTDLKEVMAAREKQWQELYKEAVTCKTEKEELKDKINAKKQQIEDKNKRLRRSMSELRETTRTSYLDLKQASSEVGQVQAVFEE